MNVASMRCWSAGFIVSDLPHGKQSLMPFVWLESMPLPRRYAKSIMAAHLLRHLVRVYVMLRSTQFWFNVIDVCSVIGMKVSTVSSRPSFVNSHLTIGKYLPATTRQVLISAKGAHCVMLIPLLAVWYIVICHCTHFKKHANASLWEETAVSSAMSSCILWSVNSLNDL